MPIDVEKVLGAKLTDTETTWDADQVILYHLALGAGRNPIDPKELEYCYEGGNLKVLPSYGVIPAGLALAAMWDGSIKGLEFNPALVLHGEQELEVSASQIPISAKAKSSGRIAAVYDKGKAALLVLEVESRTAAGDPLFVNRYSLFLRGEGGFGGDPGPKDETARPAREPDAVVESPTLPQQALIYRLLGDKNPLHADPQFAAFGGFERPILHGLCSYGVVCKAVVDTLLEGDTKAVAAYRARFAGIVIPGDTIVTSMWKEGSVIHLEATDKERGTPVLTRASIKVR